MGEVISLGGITTLDINPDQVLEKAIGELEGVVVMGYDKDGMEYFASSWADGGTVIWLMERLKRQLLDSGDI